MKVAVKYRKKLITAVHYEMLKTDIYRSEVYEMNSPRLHPLYQYGQGSFISASRSNNTNPATLL